MRSLGRAICSIICMHYRAQYVNVCFRLFLRRSEQTKRVPLSSRSRWHSGKFHHYPHWQALSTLQWLVHVPSARIQGWIKLYWLLWYKLHLCKGQRVGWKYVGEKDIGRPSINLDMKPLTSVATSIFDWLTVIITTYWLRNTPSPS